MDMLVRLNQLIDRKGWSVNHLANEAGITQSTLSSVFARQSPPSIPTLQKICVALGITLADFFSDVPEDVPLELRQLLNEARRLSPKQVQQVTDLIKSLKD